MVHNIGNVSAYYAQISSQKQQNAQPASDIDIQQLIASLLNNNAATASAQSGSGADNNGDNEASPGPCCGASSSASNISGQNMMQLISLQQGTGTDSGNTAAPADPNNTGSVNAQPPAQSIPHGHHHHHSGGGDQAAQLEQSLFSAMDTNGDSAATQAELEQSITKAGGTKQSADALYALLDPNNTGSFMQSTLNEVI
jgi:hypothetical protein